ncbi:hypothetical protein LIER_16613 [Lithospermum erythrorhizon]|uniref:Uncharacterized protein n=1 Tax=Lithospermum erythrorhizon TaxID=34254 RepID=A0AAV3Q8V4_LITER
MGFLDHYQSISGKVINKQKSSCIFLDKLTVTRANVVLKAMGFKKESLPFTYLAMKMPSTVQEKVKTILNKFLSGDVTWCRWGQMCRSFEAGGLNCRFLEDISDTCMVKSWFRLRAGTSLWSKYMLAKYCRNAHPLHDRVHMAHSRIWKRLVAKSTCIGSLAVGIGHIRLLIEVLILRSLWVARNKDKYGEQRYSFHGVVKRVNHCLSIIRQSDMLQSDMLHYKHWKEDLEVATLFDMHPLKPRPKKPMKLIWVKPQMGILKLNIDGAFKDSWGGVPYVRG